MDKYIYKPYSPTYPSIFLKEKDRLQQILGNDVLIEHIGSTAIPELGGKGIIDILIAVPREQMQKFSELVQKAGYEYKQSGGNEERIFHQRDENNEIEGLLRYHLHITFPESNTWKEDLAFRNYLRNNPEEVRHYAEIKKKAASESDQIKDKYMAIKEPVIKEILSKALRIT